MFVLRKSIGAFSAGTSVRLVGIDFEKLVYTVEADRFMYVTKEGNTKLTKVTDKLEVAERNLVQQRNRTDSVPAVARKDRDDRVSKRVVYNMQHKREQS